MAHESRDRATIARLAEEVLPTLIERLTRSDLGELEVREDGWRVRLRRPLENGTAAVQPARATPAAHGAALAHAPSLGAPREAGRGMVSSPAVGYFTPRAGLEAGSAVRSGDVVGHVDVLGVRHEVAAEAGGTLRGFEVEAGQAVEYGQAIARVEAEA